MPVAAIVTRATPSVIVSQRGVPPSPCFLCSPPPQPTFSRAMYTRVDSTISLTSTEAMRLFVGEPVYVETFIVN